ncbi:MAG: SDR family oxidoreductase [Gordonia sp. (in: high G+C Gram-positive bacteria)]|uniref:SDR family oxidoreductase n=1 Tax=Gordonia sp. (in: high G+C Gram-positive bacteria) TaxID=84139 RepID=UPI003C735095
MTGSTEMTGGAEASGGVESSERAEEGRCVIVTGAGSGIGLAVTERLRRRGDRVLAVDLHPEAVGGETLAADLTTRAGNRAAVDTALERFGRIDAVVAGAGFQHVESIRDFDPDAWDGLLGILLTSPFLLAKYAWEALEAAPGGGRFVVIASAHSLTASPFKSGYVSAKHGVVGLVRTIALEGADVGICATALCPAYVRTPLVEKQIDDQARTHGMSADEVVAKVMLERQAVKRLIEPAEVAAAVEFLLTPAGRAFTGAALPMDQGWTAQ